MFEYDDKKVTDFRQEMQCVEDAGIYPVPVSFARVHGCKRECGATDLCWREGGRWEGSGHSYSQLKILTLSKILTFSHILSPKRSTIGDYSSVPNTSPWSLIYFWGLEGALVSYWESDFSSVGFPLAPNLDALRCLRCYEQSPDRSGESGDRWR